MALCNKCGQVCDTQKTVIRDGKLFSGCDKCIPAQVQQGNPMSAKHFREAQKIQHRKDLIQPNQVEFGRAFPEKAREMYGEETYRLIS